MTTPIIIESDYGAQFTVKFYDKNGDPATPVTVTYRVDCLTNDQNIVTDTEVSPDSTIQIPVDATWTAIIDTTRSYETRRLSVTASGLDWQKTQIAIFKVKNAKRISGD